MIMKVKNFKKVVMTKSQRLASLKKLKIKRLF